MARGPLRWKIGFDSVVWEAGGETAGWEGASWTWYGGVDWVPSRGHEGGCRLMD